jgi:membrane-bound serine protease (ClpP class)
VTHVRIPLVFLALAAALLAAAVGGRAVAASSSSAAVSPATAPVPAPAATPAAGPAVVIRLAGEVDDYNRDQLVRRFERARSLGAKTIILEIDTYGGLVTSGLDISRFLKNQSDLHVIGFVDSKAISAGAMIALACDEIVMAPSGTLGDCAPIQMDRGVGVVPMGAAERAKAESPILSDFMESAERHGYSRELAVAMVSTPLSVYWVEDGEGNRRFVDAKEFARLTGDGKSGDGISGDGKWKVVAGEPSPIDGPDTLLTVHTERAIRYGLARGSATSASALAAQRGLTVVATYSNGTGDQIVSLLGSTVARVIFLIIFINALLLALKTPGTGAAEAVAVVSLGLLVGVPLLTGYAEWWEIGLIVVGIALIAFEVFVFPGHLVSIILGTIMLGGGLILTFVGDVWRVPGAWNLPGTWTAAKNGLYVTVFGIAASLLVFTKLSRLLPRVPYFNRLILAGAGRPVGGPVAAPPPEPADHWPFVGTVGVAATDLRPGGTARFPFGADERNTSVVCENGFVTAGTKLVVREVQGSHVVVRVV